MKIRILGSGTSQGIPVVGCECDVCKSDNANDSRLRASILVSKGDTNILVDTGPDLRQQLLTNNIADIEAVVYTHEHNDHVIGLDDIRPLYFRYQSNIPTYGLERVNKEIQKRFSYMFGDKVYPGVAQIDVNHITKETSSFSIGNIKIIPVGVMHGHLNILGYRFDNMAYITDASKIEKTERLKLANLDVLIINALQLQTHHSHFTLDQAIDVIRELQPKAAYITHISHTMGLAENVSKKLPAGISLAYDNQIIK